MRKLKLFLSLLMVMLLSVGNVWATEDPVEITANFQCSCSEAGTSPDLFTATGGSTGASYYSFAPGSAIISNNSYDVDPSQSVSITMNLGTYGGYESGKNDVSFYLVNGNGEQISTAFTSNFTAKYTSNGGKAFSGSVTLNDGQDGKGVYFKFVPVVASGGKYARFHTLSITYTPAAEEVPSFSITAQSNDNSKGTVSLSGSVITGSPKAGFRYASPAYSVSPANSATVSQNGNAFTVTPSANTTVTINFEAIPQYTVTWNNNGVTSTSQVYEGAKPEFPATPAACDASSTTFIGWATAPWDGKIANLSEKTVYTSADAMPTVNADVTYYAVFAKSSGSASDLFTWAGGSSTNLSAAEGVYSLSADSKDYADATYSVKWNGTGKNIVIEVASQPGKVAAGFKMIGGNSTSTITVQEADAADGTFTDVENLSISGATDDVVNLETTASFKSTTRAIKLYYTKGSNVGLGPISIEGAVSYSDYLTTCCAKKTITIASGIENGTVSADPTSACEGATVTLTYTPAGGYHLDSWSVNSVAQDISDNTFTMPDEAVTVSATFVHDDCTNLLAPTLDGVTKTYNSATIAWNTVTDAVAYAVSVVKDGEAEPVFSGNVNALSKDLADLEPETQYNYTIMAIGDGTVKCADGNGELVGNFTTEALPTAHLTLMNLGEEHTSSGDYAILTPFNLPTKAAACSKAFVGWDADPDCATAPTYAKGAEFTFANTTGVTLYAVYADELTPGTSSYVKTALADIASGSEVIVTEKKGESLYAMANDGGTSNPPVAVAVTDEEGVLTGGVVAKVLWTLTKDGDNFSLAKGDDKLYCTNTNNGVRVGSNENNVFAIKDNYLFNNATSRYVGVYNSQDFRCYTSINSNITGQTLAFYKKTVSDPVYGNYSTVCQPQAATPTFTVEAGTYYAAQSIELGCTTENATIYYTTDGSAPSTSSTKYTAAISLSERAITTVKAIAVAEGYENSPVATAEYNINLPYDFADFAALTNKENGKEYVVRGIISEKGTQLYSGKLPYYISANGSTEGQIKCHNGLKLDKAEFTSVNDVNLGDNVTVVGTWSTQYSNLNAGNWMLEYTARVHDSYEIEGGLTTTTFQVGEAFDNAILGNLSVKEVFTNGYEETVAGATFNCGDKTEWLENETSLTVYAKLGDDDLTSKNFGVTVSSATLVSFVLKEGYKTEYYVGDEFVKPTVIATLTDNTHPEAEATACTGYNMSAAGNYTVNVAFTYGDITIDEGVTYQITVKAVFDNEDAPHTVAIAKELIEPYTTTSANYMWVRGIVSQVGNLSSGKLKYYISDNGATEGQLYVYDGKYIGGVNFTDANKLQVNDEVVIKGKAQNYQGNTLELTSSQVISLARGVEVTVANVAELEVGQADLAVEDLTITTLSEGDVTFVSGDEAIATIVDNKIHAVAAGVVTITANVAANGIYKAASADFTVNVVAIKDRYTVTFSAGEAGENVSGDSPEAIDDQLENAPVTLPACTWTWEGHKFTGWAVTYGENVPVDVENNQFNMPAANVTLTAQWAEVVTAKISFMVGGEEKVSIYKEQEVAFTIEQDGADWAPAGFTFVGWSTTEYAEEAAAAPATITEYTPQAGIAEVSLYGIYSRHDDSDPNYGKYEKATAVVDGDYLIVNEEAGKAFNGDLTTLDAAANTVAVEINEGVIGNSIAVDNAIFTIDATAGTVKSHSGYYIGVAGYSNGLNQSGNAADYINELGISEGNAAIEMTFTGGTMHLLYNTSNRFRYYKAENQTNKAIQLYKKNTGTMWYTSSPAEKVAITFDANGGEGGCTKAIINKGAQLTICTEAPTKSHSEFAGWKNGDDEYVAGQAYTFDADITLTAQWNDAATYTVTFDKNEGEGTAENLEGQYAGDEITLPAALTKDDYTFQGWKYDDKLYKAGASFTMVADNITFVAQFRKTSVPTNKMSLVTDASALANGMQVTLGCSYVKDEESYFAMAGDLGSNKYMASVTEDVSLVDNIATYPNTVVVLTLEQVEDGWNITKDGANYLTLSGSSDLKWDTKTNATVWAISFEDGNVKIANGHYWIQYNSGSPRFKPYNSNQKQIQLFGQAVVVTENISISDLGYTEGATIVADGDITLTIDEQTNAQSITAKNGATVEVNQPTTAESVVVEDGSRIEANAPTTTPTVYFSTTMGSTQVPGTASELGSVTNITLATGGEIIYDLTLGTSMEGIQADPNQWHAFTLPFAVDALNGIYDAETGAKLQNEVNYAIMDYHGDIRANGQYGWKKYRGILQPGVFYLMTVDGNTKTFRFKAAKVGAMTQTTSMSVTAFNGSGASSDYGWNGIGNPSWVSGTVTVNVQVLDPYTYTYQTLTSGTNLTVSTPFFYNAGGSGSTGSVVMQDAGNGANYAPARTPANEIKNVAVSFGNEVFRDKIYISASEDALNEYEQDKDLVRMIMSNTPKVAQIYGKAYGMKLAMVNAPMSNDKAEYSLTLYAPNAGEYTISAPAMEDADIYLTKDGAIIWNLSMSEYTNDFAKGNNEGYGLLLVKKGPQVVTGVENIEAVEAGVQKVVVDQNVFILRGEKMYDVTGKMVK